MRGGKQFGLLMRPVSLPANEMANPFEQEKVMTNKVTYNKDVLDLLTQEQKNNLRKLSDFLLSGISHDGFDMEMYRNETKCGTVACAAGHGPLAGIEKLPTENWSAYCYRAFGAGVGLVSLTSLKMWTWLFGSEWKDTDNTPEGAAIRIQILLDRGLPSRYALQMHGAVPLCYSIPSNLGGPKEEVNQGDALTRKHEASGCQQ